MEPSNNTPPANDPAQEPNNEPDVPSWAQQLIEQNTELTNRISAFEESLKTPEVQPAPVDDDPQEPAWKPKSWEDVASRIEETAEQKAQRIIEDREKAAAEAAEQAASAAAEAEQYLDSQVDELTKANKLPAVVNENDPNDPGKLARQELFGYALSLGTADLKSTQATLDALHKAGKTFDFVKMELVDKNPAAAGADSPVGSSSAGGSGTSTRPDYKTIHNMSLDSLASRFSQHS